MDPPRIYPEDEWYLEGRNGKWLLRVDNAYYDEMRVDKLRYRGNDVTLTLQGKTDTRVGHTQMVTRSQLKWTKIQLNLQRQEDHEYFDHFSCHK
jgi:hypothetical protein